MLAVSIVGVACGIVLRICLGLCNVVMVHNTTRCQLTHPLQSAVVSSLCTSANLVSVCFICQACRLLCKTSVRSVTIQPCAGPCLCCWNTPSGPCLCCWNTPSEVLSLQRFTLCIPRSTVCSAAAAFLLLCCIVFVRTHTDLQD